jgi:hypothetical protein
MASITFRARLLCMAVTVLASAGPTWAAAGTSGVRKNLLDNYIQFGAGIDYSQGTYGDITDTKVTSLPLSVKVVRGRLALKVAVPFVHISGPGSLLTTTEGSSGGSGSGSSGSGSTPGGSGSGSSGSSGDIIVLPGGRSRIDNGIGDVVASATYTFDLVPGSLFFDATGKVKLPTASTRKRLGTGKTDVTVAGTLTKVLGSLSVYGEGRRRFAGRSAAFPLRDTWGASTGAALAASRNLTLGVDYDWQQSAFRLNGPSSELTGSATVRLSPALRLQAYGVAGLSRNSVDKGAGVQLFYRFGL